MDSSEPAKSEKPVKKPWLRPGKLRALLRACHRDVGYLLVGLTMVYAISGLAINHIGQWDPNFKQEERRVAFAEELPRNEVSASEKVLAALGEKITARDSYWNSDTEFVIEIDNGRITADLENDVIVENKEAPRFFLRVANWLHYNRGKASWTYIADGFAVLLLFLAGSGLFMIKGKNGLRWRGAIVAIVGALVPILYVHFSGGPGS